MCFLLLYEMSYQLEDVPNKDLLKFQKYISQKWIIQFCFTILSYLLSMHNSTSELSFNWLIQENIDYVQRVELLWANLFPFLYKNTQT